MAVEFFDCIVFFSITLNKVRCTNSLNSPYFLDFSLPKLIRRMKREPNLHTLY